MQRRDSITAVLTISAIYQSLSSSKYVLMLSEICRFALKARPRTHIRSIFRTMFEKRRQKMDPDKKNPDKMQKVWLNGIQLSITQVLLSQFKCNAIQSDLLHVVRTCVRT